LRKIWEKYLSECHGIVFVVDGADPIRFEEVRETLNKLYNKNHSQYSILRDLPVLFLLNKSDQVSQFVSQSKAVEDLQLR
jgi:signal recognition particle receptor subunit beta